MAFRLIYMSKREIEIEISVVGEAEDLLEIMKKERFANESGG